MDFAKNDVVTVIDEDDPYFKDQGKVAGIFDDNHEDGPIEVVIEKLRQRYEHGTFDNQRGRELGYGYKFRFFPAQLKKDDWDMETRIIRLFGPRMWHSIASIDDPLDPKKECMARDCTRNQQTSALVNYWGTVCEYYLCEECTQKWHGKCTESVPT